MELTGEFDAGSYTDVVQWLISVALCWPDGTTVFMCDTFPEIMPPGPPGFSEFATQSMLGDGYGANLCLLDVWRASAATAYARAPRPSTLSCLLSAFSSVVFACPDDARAVALSASTVAIAWTSTDDHGYGGALCISSTLSVAEVQARINADTQVCIAEAYSEYAHGYPAYARGRDA